MKSVATISGIDEYGPMLQWTTHWVDLGTGTRLYCERDILTERTAREAAEAAVARLREGIERLAARYDLIAAEHQHNADLVGEASSAYRIHLNLAGSYRERAVDVRALLEGRRYSEDEHG